MRSPATEGAPKSYGDTVISSGCWTACTSGTHSDNYRSCLRNGSLVCCASDNDRLEADTTLVVNGTHLAAEAQFLEKRRRGLTRFVTALIQHPVLREEQLVTMFLTVPTVEVCPLQSLIGDFANDVIGTCSVAEASTGHDSGRVRRTNTTPAT